VTSAADDADEEEVVQGQLESETIKEQKELKSLLEIYHFQ